MHPSIPRVMFRLRIIFYSALLLWSLLSIVFDSLRLVHTMSPARTTLEDKQDDGLPFYDPPVAELWLTSALTVPYSVLMLVIILKRARLSTLSRNWFELSFSSILFCLWFGGTLALSIPSPTSKHFQNLNYCLQSVHCQHKSALLAFAWLSTIFLFFLLVPAVLHLSPLNINRKQAWDQHVFEQWSQPNQIGDAHTTSYFEQKATGSEAGPIHPWTYQVESRTVSYRISSLSDVLPWLAWSDNPQQYHSRSPSILDPKPRPPVGPIRVKFSGSAHKV